jgi:hypothetical protein
MAGPNELDVATVLEALQALNDGIAIYGPDDRQLFVNEVAYRRFRTYYQGMADGLTHLEALTAQFKQSLPDATAAEINELAQAHYGKFNTGEPASRSTSPTCAGASASLKRRRRPPKRPATPSRPSSPT